MAVGDDTSDDPAVERLGAPVEAAQPDGCTLQGIRKALRLTRGQVAKAGGMTRYRVARIEHAEDMPVSALNRYVTALGGALELGVEFPDRPPVFLRMKRGKWVASSQAGGRQSSTWRGQRRPEATMAGRSLTVSAPSDGCGKSSPSALRRQGSR